MTSKFRPGDEATLISSPLPGSPHVGRRVLIVGYANRQPATERVYLVVGIGTELAGACGSPINVPEADLAVGDETDD
jgi:hypothetical protein